MKTPQIPVSLIAAVSPFLPKYDIRDAFKHICIEIFENGFNIIATDGHILGVAQMKTATSLGLEEDIILLHRDVVLNVLKNSKSGDFVEVWKDKQTCFARVTGATFGSAHLDTKYPQWRAVMPKENTGVSTAFNPELIQKICDCAKLYKKYQKNAPAKGFGIQLEQNLNSPSSWSLSGGLPDGVSIAGCIAPLRDVKATAFETISKISK